jgi:hypothetical protein
VVLPSIGAWRLPIAMGIISPDALIASNLDIITANLKKKLQLVCQLALLLWVQKNVSWKFVKIYLILWPALGGMPCFFLQVVINFSKKPTTQNVDDFIYVVILPNF